MKEGVVAMPERVRDYQRELSGIMNAISESVAATPPEVLLAECRDEGIDVEVAATRTKSVLADAIKRHKQQKLREARQEYEARVRSMQSTVYSLPQSMKTKRDLLAAVFKMKPEFRGILTAAARDFRELSDADVDLALRQLQDLGALGDLSSQDDVK